MNNNWEPSQIENKIGINFKYDQTLRLALIHPSYAKLIKEPEINNQRLELLGENILNLVLVDYIYWNFSHFQVGKQKALVSKLTESERLTNLWYDLQLGEFYPFLDLKEERHRLRVKPSNPFEQACKALIGAIFIDRGFTQTRNWLQKRLIIPLLKRYLKPELEHTPSDKQIQFLGNTLLQAIVVDYLYKQVHLASPSILKSLARKLTAKETQSEYLKLSDAAWSDLLPQQTKPKPYTALLAAIYLHFDNDNSKSSLRKTSTYFAQNCLDDDEIMAQAIALLLKEGKPQKWIIHKVMNYANNQYNEGREKYYQLIGESEADV
ncbi:ribonuclease III [Pleurocapsa sp. CCALA 161]|uniref:ribonuclease III domain-containing protein n=1 Tax=Pleurocapsa sp. CCALA 161 TaxID=2107688 RepID=UPI000D075BE9|nr:ribonuclease III domain-containing protein [Pleurocapsa sp. CCALA 161]PSB11881.1 ribonuclease III [Pleurocapsa sp. CCALA 161]